MSTGRPALTNLSVDQLCAIAGADPWKINDELHAGDTAAINDLAEAFHQTGFHAKESDDEFTTAKKQFTDAWRTNGSEHPINESEQVQKATAALHGHQEQLSKIAVDLEQIAAALAIAQRNADAEVASTNNDLDTIDDQITKAKAANQNWLELELHAASVVKGALGHIDEFRGAYLAQLHGAQTAMAAAGYTPDAIDDIDGSPQDGPAGAASDYEKSGQRARDQAIIDKAKTEGRGGSFGTEPGDFTKDEADAAQRLGDYTTIHRPVTNKANVLLTAQQDHARRLAGERLSDYNMAHSTGPVAKDPVLGGDARTRAEARLKMQQALMYDHWMTPDNATTLIDQNELSDRVNVLNRLQGTLQKAGMSPEGAAHVAEDMSHGIIPPELVNAGSDGTKLGEGYEEGVDKYLKALASEPGNFGLGPVGYSAHDLEALEGIAKRVGHYSSALELGLAAYEIWEGKPADEVLAKTGGGMAGAWALGSIGAQIGSAGGPVGVFAGMFVGSIAGAYLGEAGAERALQWMKE